MPAKADFCTHGHGAQGELWGTRHFHSTSSAASRTLQGAPSYTVRRGGTFTELRKEEGIRVNLLSLRQGTLEQ